MAILVITDPIPGNFSGTFAKLVDVCCLQLLLVIVIIILLLLLGFGGRKLKSGAGTIPGGFMTKKNSRAKQCAEWRLKCAHQTKTAALCATRSRAKFADPTFYLLLPARRRA